jgi:hypothetical protein
MNIFYLHKDPIKAAQMSCDKHVVKMILESAQMLCTAHRVLDGTEFIDKTANGRRIKRWKHSNKELDALLYKATHINHPSTQWVMYNLQNYVWLYRHMIALNNEFKKRYNKQVDHLTIQKIGKILEDAPKRLPVRDAKEPTPAMPDECKIPGDVVASYRKYYIMKKKDFATWRSPAVMPDWFKKGIENVI